MVCGARAGTLVAALAVCAPLTPARASHEATNALAGHPSPYLALHRSDPVHWQSWDESVVARARREGRLIFVSVGYFSCHWCHVMQRETYANVEIARQLNQHVISVKVDRELQPALDAHLVRFVLATRGHAGWPLNVFLTPEGHPLVGFTYLPPETFQSFLSRLLPRWQAERAELEEVARAAARVLAERRGSPSAGRLDADAFGVLYGGFVYQLMSVADGRSGGFGEGEKFPSVPQLSALLDLQAGAPERGLRRYLEITLEQMATQGLRDQLEGGFFRYTTDPRWQVPHFEKMLYDNALLAALYFKAARVLGEPRWESVATDTLDFLLARFWREPGAFIASLSSVDDQDVEGGYYLWDEPTLGGLLSERELEVARLAWGLEGAPALAAGYLPVQRREPREVASKLEVSEAEVQANLAGARMKLLAARARRVVPEDSKRLAGWNGLALAALARASRLESGERYRAAARRLHHYLTGTLWDGSRLARAEHGGNAIGRASLHDYAYVAHGLLAWAGLTGEEKDFAVARRVTEAAWRRFSTSEGWRLDEAPIIAHGAAEPLIPDQALPSPSALVLAASLRLDAERGDGKLRERAEAALLRPSPVLETSPFFHATHFALLSRYFSSPRAGSLSRP